MKLKNLITATTLALLPLTASAASIYVPAAGTGAGANDSHWQTELTLHNTSARPITIGISFADENGSTAPATVGLLPRSTTSIRDIVRTRFGRERATGALEITVPDGDERKIAVTSRTFNASAAGEFGQDIPAVYANEVTASGDLAVIAGPSSALDHRFNFGVYSIEESLVRWSLVRADGTLVATRELRYAAGTQRQYNLGVQALFGADARDNDVVHGLMLSGRAIFYGSAIHNRTGDPTFVPGVRVRDEIRINFVGVDVDEDGTVDVADANRDGIADEAIEIFTTAFPNFFRVVARGENGEAVTYTLVDAPADVMLVDANGTISFAPSATLKGTTGALKVRATSGSSSEVLTIPVRYR